MKVATIARYIRTQRHVYEVLYKMIFVDREIAYYGLKDTDYRPCSDVVVKESDNITDLFDYFKFCDENSKQVRFVEPKDFEHYKKNFKYTAVYGLIWVKDFLTDVAKMNEDGEWELL